MVSSRICFTVAAWTLLTYLAPSELGSLCMLHSSLGIRDMMILDKAICALQRDLCQASKLVEQFKYLGFGDPLAREISFVLLLDTVKKVTRRAEKLTNKYAGTVRKPLPFGLGHVPLLIGLECLPGLLSLEAMTIPRKVSPGGGSWLYVGQRGEGLGAIEGRGRGRWQRGDGIIRGARWRGSHIRGMRDGLRRSSRGARQPWGKRRM